MIDRISNSLLQIRSFGLGSATVAALLLCVSVTVSVGQRISTPPPPGTRPVPLRADQSTPDDPQTPSYLEEEMRVKREIRAADKAHKDNLTRARNLASLSASLLTAYEQNNHLNRDDFKNLEKIEKLAKNIREAAGGSDLDVEMDDRPTTLHGTLSKLSEVADSLKKRVEKTSKRVISAAIIDEANVLLELIRIVRSMHPKA